MNKAPLLFLLTAFIAIGSASAEPTPMKAEQCLGCHGGSLEKLAEMTPYIKNDWDEVVQPHIYIDEYAGKPHQTKMLPDCLRCHTAHSFPPVKTDTKSKADLSYCYGCHHTETFDSCTQSGCHRE